MRLSPKEHFQLIVFQKLEIEDWRSYMRNHTCLLDHHQRSHYDTITIGPEGMNWALLLKNNQLVNSFNSLVGEVQQATFSQLTQPKPKPICDRSVKPEDTERDFVVKGETSRSHEINEKRLHKELGSSERLGKPDNLSQNTRVKQAHDGSGQLVVQNNSSTHTVKEQFGTHTVKEQFGTHTVKEQFAPEENRDIASFNTDNEFNRAINEENIDFNIPGLPHTAVKQSHGTNVQGLIHKIENHPHRQALQSDLQQRQQFNPFNKE